MDTRTGGKFNSLYIALLLLSLHWSVVLYVNSTYLVQFVSNRTVSFLYVLGTLCTIIAFLYASPLLTRYGNVRLVTLLAVCEFFSLLGMAFVPSTTVIILLFIAHQAIAPLLLFSIDIFMEELIGTNESKTGGHRGLLLSLTSLTGAVAALGMGHLIGAGTPKFALAYTASALILVPFLAIIYVHFRSFKDPAYPPFRIHPGIRAFWARQDIRNVFSAHFLLQFFFSWMVIYVPVYLVTKIGFDWEQVGSILFVGLLAYVFFEYIIGFVADTYIGEKEMMAFGFAVIAITTSWFAFLDTQSLAPWMFAMFVVRIGASFVEATTESYFFKHTRGRDADLISLFRITQPLGYLMGALLGSIAIVLLPFNLLFVLLGFLMIPGLFFAMALNDTK